MLDEVRTWSLPHSLALNFAYCLAQIDGRLTESLTILERLNPVAQKPAEFYINFSLALLKARRWREAKSICETGLISFPNDLDIMGNHTIALRNCGDLDGAQESALKRIKLRRDVHSIEEAVSVLLTQARRKRDIALPDAISVAKMAGTLIAEGLSLNPRFYTLRIAQIQLHRFAHDEAGVLSLCQSLIESDQCPGVFRQVAFAEMVEHLAEGQSYKAALDLLQRAGPMLSGRLLHLKMRILARHFMIGKENGDGKRILIPEVTDYFLGTKAKDTPEDPVLSAEILEWMGEPDKALRSLEKFMRTSPSHWEGTKTMALFLLRSGESAGAMKWAERLSKIAPWRAESYDWLNYVAQQLGNGDVAQKAQARGDEVFQKEKLLFEDLRTSLDRA